MGQLSGSITTAERYQLAREAGFSPPDAIVMAAISMAECGNCDMSSYNATGDSGLWQINKVHGWSANYLSDPLNSARAAYQVWKAQGFKGWCTYPGGCGGQPGVSNWNALLTSATVAAGQVDPSAPAQINTGGGTTDTVGETQPADTSGSGNATGSVTAGTTISAPSIFGSEALGAMAAHLSSQGFWWAVLLFGLALAGIVAGVLLYFHTEIGGAAGKLAAAAA